MSYTHMYMYQSKDSRYRYAYSEITIMSGRILHNLNSTILNNA